MHVRRARAVFARTVDRTVSRAELPMATCQVFQAFDLDHSGKVELKELLCLGQMRRKLGQKVRSERRVFEKGQGRCPSGHSVVRSCQRGPDLVRVVWRTGCGPRR